MKTTAAVLVQTAKPLELMDLTIPPLKQGQVLVRIDTTGVCHTQLLEARGHRGHDPFLPHCLGHEGAGVVLDTAPNITKVKPGQRVILSWLAGSGAQVPGCTYTDARGRTVNAGAMTTFMTLAVVSENRLTPTPPNLSTTHAAMLGCALPTGFGAVLNTGQLTQGQTVAVFGCGGVGLSAVAAAAAAGASQVIAIDPVPAKRAVALALGATHTLDPAAAPSSFSSTSSTSRAPATPDTTDILAALATLAPDGIDLAIEATGRTNVMAAALVAVKPRGGKAVVIGNARQGQLIQLDPKQLNLGKQLRGTWGGDTHPDRDIPRFASLLTNHNINLAPMLTQGYTLASINNALDDLENHAAVRPIVHIHDTHARFIQTPRHTPEAGA